MNAFVSCVLLACALATANAMVGKGCAVQSECDTGECCQIMSEFQVVSRRNAPINAVYSLPPVLMTRAPRTGTCQKYTTEGKNCNSFDKMNGYCSCSPELTCKSYKDPNYIEFRPVPTAILMTMPPTFAPSKRNLRMMRPGYLSTCEKP